MDDGVGLSAKTDYTVGGMPSAITTSPDGTSVYVANYSANTVSMYRRDTSTGALIALAIPTIGTGSSPRKVSISPDGTSVYVANYYNGAGGNTVSMYRRDTSTGALTALTPLTVPAGASPNDITISSDGAFVYVANWIGGNISMYSRDPLTGLLIAFSPATVPSSGAATSIVLSPDGTSAYVPNWTSATVSMFSRDVTTGLLTALATPTIATGSSAGFVSISPDGTSVYVANSTSNTVSMYSRTIGGVDNGKLTALTPPTTPTGTTPYGITVSPDGTAVFVGNNGSGSVSQYSRNSSTGALTALSPATVTAGAGPFGINISPDGTSVYVANNSTNTVSMFSRASAPGFELGTLLNTVQTGVGSGASVGLATTTSNFYIDGSYTVHRFTNSGTFQVTSGTGDVEYLVVAGGGGGGKGANSNFAGGGGGAGGLLTGTIANMGVGSYVVTVGAGGLGNSTITSYPSLGVAGTDGSASTFNGLVAIAGGGGGGSYNSPNGRNGGSGGGASLNGSSSGTRGLGQPGQGNDGGLTTAGGAGGAGGGGQSTVGSSTSVYAGGNGGAGFTSSISGSLVLYAAGGGGGGYSSGNAGGASVGGGAGGTAGVAGGRAIMYGSGGGGGGVAGGAYGAETASGNGQQGVVVLRYLTGAITEPTSPGPGTSGTFTSAPINTGSSASFTTLSYTSTLNGQTLTLDARAGDTATPPVWGTYNTDWPSGAVATGITSGVTNNIATLAGHQYIQYRANLSSTNSAITPTLDSVTISYSTYATSGDLTSSKYDSGVPTNTFSKVRWVASTPAGTGVQFQVRTSADGTTWTAWCGPVDCSGSGTNGFFTTSNQSISNSTLTDSTNDQWIQYKAFLTSSGATSPTLMEVVLEYVQNGAPVVSNVIPSQITDPANANYGKVVFSFDASDADTEQGSLATKNKVTPTLYEYYNGASWATISSGLSANAFSVIDLALNTTVVNTTVTWTPPAGLYANNTAKIRVTVTDGEGANFSAVGTSGVFTLDSTKPTIGGGHFIVDSSTGGTTGNTLKLSASDDTNISYRVCNDNTFPATDTQGNSCAWVAVGATSISTSTTQNISSSWVFVDATSAATVYIQVRDAYGNVNTDITSVTVPAQPTTATFLSADVSNPAAGTFGETLSWIASANANSYQVWYGMNPPSSFGANDANTATAPSSYSLLATPLTNVYAHTIARGNATSLATTTAYWYKVAAVSANGDISGFATLTTGDVPDGFGTTLPDTTAPEVTFLTVGNIHNTSAEITFTTNELAVVQVLYGTASCSTATPVTTSYVPAHSVYITGLLPGTDYYYCARATDVLGNVSAVVPAPVPTFRTDVGPVISNVTEREITDTSALIFWNTTASSTSYVKYATTKAGVNGATQVGSATLVEESPTVGVYQHQVGLPGLTFGLTYYYKVISADSIGNSTSDDNNGQYYSFVTLRDTSPPVISSIATPVTSSNAIVIVWTTDEPATSQILWGTALSDRTHYTTTDNTKSIYHVVTLSSATTNAGVGGGTNELTPSSTYYYVVKSDDVAGNTATSPEQSVTTPATGAVTITNIVAVSVSNTQAGATPDTTAPVISNIKVSEVTPFGATVGFEVSEDTVGFVEYGKDTSYLDTAGDKSWATIHSIKLRGLTLGSDYHVKVSAVDKSGNTGTSADQTFTTTFLSENFKDMANVENIEQFQKEIESAIESILPSLVPPFVSKPQVSDITESGATITFKTNIKAFPVVVYADAGTYDSTKDNPYTGEVSDTVTKGTDHTLKLSGLKGNTTYHLEARAFSLPKVIGKSTDLTFITKAAKIQGSIVERKKDSFTVAWVTDEPTSSIMEFKNLRTGITERKVDDAKKTSHSMKVDNLPSGTTYAVDISGINEQGNIAEAGASLSVTTSTDTTPPTISNFKVDNALIPGRTDRIQTIVSWITDEPANSIVYYEEGAGLASDTTELANKNETLDSYVVRHSIIVPSLKAGTIYRLKVTSADDSDNLGSFGPRTIITPKQTESITDIIFKNFEESFKFLRKI